MNLSMDHENLQMSINPMKEADSLIVDAQSQMKMQEMGNQSINLALRNIEAGFPRQFNVSPARDFNDPNQKENVQAAYQSQVM